MVNSMVGKMGQAVADATRRAGLELVPYTLCPADVAAASKHLTIDGQQIELLGPDTRDAAIEGIKKQVCVLSKQGRLRISVNSTECHTPSG